jgi:hypothetical protein
MVMLLMAAVAVVHAETTPDYTAAEALKHWAKPPL